MNKLVKKFFVLPLMGALIAGLAMTSCQKEDVSADTEDVALAEITYSAAREAAAIDSTTKRVCKGKLTSIDIASLSKTITDYITKTYAGSTVKYAGTDTAGNTVVGITLADGTHKGVIFDSKGAFVAEMKSFKLKAPLTSVAVSALPKVITDYIAANYAGYTTTKAGTNADGTYFVSITKDTTRTILQFDKDGKFVQVLEKPTNGHRGKKG